MPNVSLPPELERFAEECVQSGRFASVSEVAGAGLRLLQEAEARRAALLASVRAAEAEAERDGYLTPDEVETDVRRAMNAAAQRQG